MTKVKSPEKYVQHTHKHTHKKKTPTEQGLGLCVQVVLSRYGALFITTYGRFGDRISTELPPPRTDRAPRREPSGSKAAGNGEGEETIYSGHDTEASHRVRAFNCKTHTHAHGGPNLICRLVCVGALAAHRSNVLETGRTARALVNRYGHPFHPHPCPYVCVCSLLRLRFLRFLFAFERAFFFLYFPLVVCLFREGI